MMAPIPMGAKEQSFNMGIVIVCYLILRASTNLLIVIINMPIKDIRVALAGSEHFVTQAAPHSLRL